jgi:hypothetical protein
MPATPAFPPPWVAEENERRDANGQALTMVAFTIAARATTKPIHQLRAVMIASPKAWRPIAPLGHALVARDRSRRAGVSARAGGDR